MNYRKLISALKFAVKELEIKRREYSPANVAYTRQGIRAKEFSGDGIEGVTGLWVEQGHKKHKKITDVIDTLQDWIEVLET